MDEPIEGLYFIVSNRLTNIYYRGFPTYRWQLVSTTHDVPINAPTLFPSRPIWDLGTRTS
jgi:hypothetical protein